MVHALLLDLDGVLYVGDAPIAGAIQALDALKQANIAIAGVTNTTTQSKRQLAAKLARLGLAFSLKQLFTPAALACARIGEHTAALYVRESLHEDFAGIKEEQEHPDFVVMGDIGGEGYAPEVLKEIFLHVMDGASLLALHKNRFWAKPDGLHLDLGVFVAAVEYATGCKAEVLGKPSPAFFHAICDQLGVAPAEAVMVGDDIESDIKGAQGAGLRAILVRTGKYRADFAAKSGIQPDLTIDSIADLPASLAKV